MNDNKGVSAETSPSETEEGVQCALLQRDAGAVNVLTNSLPCPGGQQSDRIWEPSSMADVTIDAKHVASDAAIEVGLQGGMLSSTCSQRYQGSKGGQPHTRA